MQVRVLSLSISGLDKIELKKNGFYLKKLWFCNAVTKYLKYFFRILLEATIMVENGFGGPN